MAEFLAYRIIQGKLSYEKVPEKLKAEIKTILAELGHPDLAE